MTAQVGREKARIHLLGTFHVSIGDRERAEDEWPGRRSAELVQLLALTDAHRLAREEVIDALWPHLDPEAGAANLRKAAHHARRALGDREGVVLGGGFVALLPSIELEVDVERFEREGDAAVRAGDPVACRAAAELYSGDLLPASPYEEWTQEPRRRLRSLMAELLRCSGQWGRLIEIDPADEPSYRELIRAELAAGRRHAAIRWYGRLRSALARELGIRPSDETEALYEECLADAAGPLELDLVGREIELAKAELAIRAAAHLEVGALALRGPAGIGKSALCRRIAEMGRSEGWVVVKVEPTDWNVPFAPLADAVEQLLAGDRASLDAVPERARSVLAELTPLAAPAPPLDGTLTRQKVIGAVRRLLAACVDAGAAGAMLLIEDAHTADDATVDAVRHLAHAPDRPFLAVLAYRSERAPDALAGAMGALERAGRAVQLDLPPIERMEAERLVAIAAPASPSADVIAQIADLAEGNPFFLLELAKVVDPERALEVPTTVWGAVAARLVDLDPGTLALLERLAVASDDLDLASVLALMGGSETDAFAVLDAALDAGALIVSGSRYRFRHELVRRALIERLPEHRRVAIHRDAARRLVAADAPAPMIARHWLAGSRPDEALDWLLAAAREAIAVGAFADALAQLEPLLEHAPDHAAALGLRAEALDALGDPRAPDAYAEAANAVGEPASHEIRAKEALARLKSGDPSGALGALEGASPKTTAGRLCQALTLSGAAAVGFGDAAVAAAKAEETRRLAIELKDPGAIVEASWAGSLAAHAQGELPDRLQADLTATQVPELAIRVYDGHLCATERLLYGGRPYEEVISFADALAAEARRLGAARGHGFALTLRGEAMLLSGRLDEAEEDLVAGARLHREIGASAGESLALQRRAEVALNRDHAEEADALIAEALSAARESSLEHHLLDRIYGTRIMAAADPKSGLAAVEEAESAVRGPAESCPACRATLVVPAAIAAARAGDLDRARAYAETAEMLAEVILRLPGWRAATDEVKGNLASAAGDPAGAAMLFRRAADGFRGAGQPLDEARCAALAADRC